MLYHHSHHGVRAKSAPLKIRQLKMGCRIFSPAFPCSSFIVSIQNEMVVISAQKTNTKKEMHVGKGIKAAKRKSKNRDGKAEDRKVAIYVEVLLC